MKRVGTLLLSTLLSGCASLMNDSAHALRIETRTMEGNSIDGARCSISGAFGSITTRSGEPVQVRRSSQDLDITCSDESKPDAKGRLISRMNAGMVGNILIGGVIGIVIDHSKGTGYTYPTWIQMIFGKSLVFDRANEEHGKPVKGTDVVSP